MSGEITLWLSALCLCLAIAFANQQEKKNVGIIRIKYGRRRKQSYLL